MLTFCRTLEQVPVPRRNNRGDYCFAGLLSDCIPIALLRPREEWLPGLIVALPYGVIWIIYGNCLSEYRASATARTGCSTDF